MEQMSADYEKIRATHSHNGQVLRITLVDPPGNILDSVMMRDMMMCLEREGLARGLKVIVFEGEGKNFCFGASVKEHQKELAPAMIRSFHDLFKKLLDLALPTVSVVRGRCLGGGMELAAFCNFVIAEPSARFAQPEITLAVFPPVAALILPDIVGQARAENLLLTGQIITAATAREWGLVYEIADHAETALEILLEKQLLPKSAAALRFAYRAARFRWRERLPADLDRMERLYVSELMETEDANEGITSFLEKRPPSWKNR